jgi:HSP20 family molecular chaperone IbpA
MELKRKFRISLVLVSILVCVSLIEGIIIIRNLSSAKSTDRYGSQEHFSSFLENLFKKEKNQTWGILDDFFNEDFFRTETDPFKEAERLRRQWSDMMEKETKKSFQDAWDGWFSDRFFDGSDEIGIETKEKGDAYVMELKIPNLKQNKLTINVDKNGISVEGEFTQIAEKKDPKGNVIRKHEVHRKISRQFPIPYDANHEKAEIKNKGDEVIIILPKAKA